MFQVPFNSSIEMYNACKPGGPGGGLRVILAAFYIYSKLVNVSIWYFQWSLELFILYGGLSQYIQLCCLFCFVYVLSFFPLRAHMALFLCWSQFARELCFF